MLNHNVRLNARLKNPDKIDYAVRKCTSYIQCAIWDASNNSFGWNTKIRFTLNSLLATNEANAIELDVHLLSADTTNFMLCLKYSSIILRIKSSKQHLAFISNKLQKVGLTIKKALMHYNQIKLMASLILIFYRLVQAYTRSNVVRKVLFASNSESLAERIAASLENVAVVV